MTDAATALTQAPTKPRVGRKPGPRRASDVPRIPRLTALVKQACEVLIEGHAKTVSDAAKLIGCSREHLYHMFKKPHVEAYFARERERKVRGPVATSRAASVYIGLLDSPSEKVKMDVSERILMEAGTLSRNTGRGANISVNVHAGHIITSDEDRKALLGMNVDGPGYVVDLSPKPRQLVDRTAEDAAEAV